MVDRSSVEMRKTYRQMWIRPYGHPKVLVVDNERGIVHCLFKDKANAEGTHFKITAAYSAHHNARIERLGGVWKDMYFKQLSEHSIESHAEFLELVDSMNVACCEMRSCGRVFGRPPRMPEGTCNSEEPPTLEILSTVGCRQGMQQYRNASGCA